MLGCSRKQVNEIVHGRAPITADTATRLDRVVGIPADVGEARHFAPWLLAGRSLA